MKIGSKNFVMIRSAEFVQCGILVQGGKGTAFVEVW